MDASLEGILALYMLSTGRRLFALRRVGQIATELGLIDIAKQAADAVKYDEGTRATESEWATASTARKGVAALEEIDPLTDRTLVAIRDAIVAHVSGAEPHDDIASEANALNAALFPRGVQAVTQATYVDELSAVDGILLTLKSKRFAPLVVELGLSRLEKRLAKLALDYRNALEGKNPATIDFSQVRASRAQGHNNLLQIVAVIIGKFPGNTPDDVSSRTALLTPILMQNEAARQFLRARRAIDDIDPETGAVDPNAPAIPSAPTENV